MAYTPDKQAGFATSWIYDSGLSTRPNIASRRSDDRKNFSTSVVFPEFMTTPKIRMLTRAAVTVGSEAALAEALGVSNQVLAEWLEGKSAPPDGAYFVAMDIVANGAMKRKSN
jgi:DNA-binding transcriptional regulator YiaG